MTTIQLKDELHQIIDSIDDVGILKAIRVLLQKQTKNTESDFWDDLPENVKESILRGLQQIENGETISHENVLQEIREKYQSK